MVTATFFHLLFHINVLYYLYLVNALNRGYMCNSIGWQETSKKPPEKWKVNFKGLVGFLTGQMFMVHKRAVCKPSLFYPCTVGWI